MYSILAATALSKPVSAFVKIFMLITTQTLVGIPVDVELDMIEQGIPFEIVEEMPERFTHAKESFAYYSADEDMIFFVSEDGTFSYGEFLVAATHEMIHYYRDQLNGWSDDQWMEEAIACYGVPVLDQEMGMDNVDLSRKECDKFFLASQKANGFLNPRLPSNQEMEKIKENIECLSQFIFSD